MSDMKAHEPDDVAQASDERTVFSANRVKQLRAGLSELAGAQTSMPETTDLGEETER